MRLTDKINAWLNDMMDRHHNEIWYGGVILITLVAMVLGIILIRASA